MKKKVFELDFHGRKLVVEHGELAKQADGAVLVRYNDTVVLTAAVVSKNVNLLSDFFPLTVNYQEKLYSVGKIPGGFIKREGRPSEAATLAARMIDRPMRPLFPEGFKNEVQIISTVLSVDQDCSPELTARTYRSIPTTESALHPWRHPNKPHQPKRWFQKPRSGCSRLRGITLPCRLSACRKPMSYSSARPAFAR